MTLDPDTLYLRVSTGTAEYPGGIDPQDLQSLPLSFDAEQLRLERLQIRERILEETDKLMIPDRPLDPLVKAEWVAYRQALRDWPQTGVWPSPPDPV